MKIETLSERIANAAEMYFLEGMMNSDDSERERYTVIYMKLLAGETVCTDNEEGEII